MERQRPRWTDRWRAAVRPDSDLAEAEGLAAGTGLLTGEVARQATARIDPARLPPCPDCGETSEVVVVDLVAETTTHRCVGCGHRWTVSNRPPSTSDV